MQPINWTKSSAPVLVLALGMQGACSEAAPPKEPFAVRDSAGIRIVESMLPVSSHAWSVVLEPDVVIGGDEADSTQQLFRVSGALGLHDGRIVIAHGPAPMLRWYDSSGNFELGAGRPGGGPGEFGGGEGAWISAIWPLAGDSLATWEHPPRRMQVFSPQGEFVRSVVLDLPPDMSVGAYPQVVGRMGGNFIAFLAEPREPGTLGEVIREPMRFIRFHPDGSYAGEIASLPGFTAYTYQFRMSDGREMPVTGRPPFAKGPVSWPGEDLFYYGSGDRYEIGAWDSTGGLRVLIRKAEPNRSVTDEDIERYRSETMAGAPEDPQTRQFWKKIVDDAPYPEYFPAYRRMRVDRPGFLWVQDYDPPGADSVTWSVFDRTGQWLNRVVIPSAWQIMDIGPDYVLVLVRDELDIERVERHALIRG